MSFKLIELTTDRDCALVEDLLGEDSGAQLAEENWVPLSPSTVVWRVSLALDVELSQPFCLSYSHPLLLPAWASSGLECGPRPRSSRLYFLCSWDVRHVTSHPAFIA
jgi:hypothetical protein